MTDRNRIPVLVGAGQITDTTSQPPHGRAPLAFLAEVAQAAAQDTGAPAARLLAALDSIAVVRLYSDSSPRFATPFGAMENPPWSLARVIGATPSEYVYPAPGGDSPQSLVTRACRLIAEGRLRSALIVGAEPLRSELAARRAGLQLDWSATAPFAPDSLGEVPSYYKQTEEDHGLRSPSAMYGLIGQALRLARGQTIDAYRAASARLFEGFAAVARENPLATRRDGFSAERIGTTSDANPMVGFPFGKLMTASAFVDQAAALIACSEAEADAMGIPAAKRVYLHGAAAAHDTWFVSDRERLDRSPAMRLAAERALALAGRSMQDMDLLDIYSCFPSAVQIACKELDLQASASRPLTVTGGLAFFGGPGNNYSTHAIAQMVQRLRDRPESFGLVLANGGLVTKESIGVYSTRPSDGRWLRDAGADDIQSRIDAESMAAFNDAPLGAATIENFTVLHVKGVAQRGIVFGRLRDTRERFIANLVADAAQLAALEADDPIGRVGDVERAGPLNLFRLRG